MMLLIATANADVINIKSDAPQTYVVKKGDTLWDISNLFLDKPWLWPELWRNNVQIENPHLIYPGDVLKLRYIDGVPTFEVLRDKARIALSPNKRIQVKAIAVGVLPWSRLAPYVNNDSIMSEQEYLMLPRLLGDTIGSPGFVEQDFVLSHRIINKSERYDVVRKQREVKDSKGKLLGFQVDHLANAEALENQMGQQQMIRLKGSQQEARPGDKLRPKDDTWSRDMTLKAATSQKGELVSNIEDRKLIGKHDVVILNLGSRFIEPGTVMGIYSQGPAIYDSEKPVYEREKSAAMAYFSFNERVEQPAIKVGELVVFKTFENASYAWVTKTKTHLQGGEIVAKP